MPTAAEGRRKFAARFVGNSNSESITDNNNHTNTDNKSINFSSDHNSRKERRRIRHKQKHNTSIREDDETNNQTNSAATATITSKQLRPLASSSELTEQENEMMHRDNKVSTIRININNNNNHSNAINAENLHLDLSGLQHNSAWQERIDTFNKDQNKDNNNNNNSTICKTNNKQYNNKKSKQVEPEFSTSDVNVSTEGNRNTQSNSVRPNCNNALWEEQLENNFDDNINIHSRQMSEEIIPSLMRSSHCSVNHGPIITEAWARSVIKPGEEFLLHDVRYPHAFRKNSSSDIVNNIKGTNINRRRELHTARTAAYEHAMRCHSILHQAAEQEELALLRQEQEIQKEQQEEEEFFQHPLGVNTPRSSVRSSNEKYNSSSHKDRSDGNRHHSSTVNSVNLGKVYGEQLVQPTHVALSTSRKTIINNLRNSSNSRNNNNVPRTSRLSQTQYVRSLLLSASTRKSTKHNPSQSTTRQESHSLNRKSELLTINCKNNKKEELQQPSALMMATDNVEPEEHIVDTSPNVIQYSEEGKNESNSRQEVIREKEYTPQVDFNEYTPDLPSSMIIKPFENAPCISPRLHNNTKIIMTTESASQTNPVAFIDSDNRLIDEELQKQKNDINTQWNNSDEEKSLYSMHSYHHIDDNKSHETHPLNVGKIKENEDMDINRTDNSVHQKLFYTRSQSAMSEDSRNVGQLLPEVAGRPSNLTIMPFHNLQITNKADNSQVYSARELRTRNTPVFFSRPTYDDDTTNTFSVNKESSNIIFIDSNSGKVAFTPRFPLHPLRNSSEESVTSILSKTQKSSERELQEQEQLLLSENVESQMKENNNFYTKNIIIGNNNSKEALTYTVPQERDESQVTQKDNVAAVIDHIVEKIKIDAGNQNSSDSITKTQESEMLATIAKETELLRRARSSLLFRFYNNNNNNSKTSFGIGDGVTVGNRNKSKLLHLQPPPPILASSILHVKSATSSAPFNKLTFTQHTMYEEQEEFDQFAHINSDENTMLDHKSNEQTEQKMEKRKRPHRPNIALTSVNDLQSTVQLRNALSSRVIWNNMEEVKQSGNKNNNYSKRDAEDVMMMPESTITNNENEQTKIKYTNKGAFSNNSEIEPTKELGANEESYLENVSLDAALMDMIADPLFLIISDENHCRLLVLNEEYMARNALIECCYYTKNNNNDDDINFLIKEKKSVNNERNEYEQLEPNPQINSLFLNEPEMEPPPRKPTTRALEMTKEPKTHLYTSSSSSSTITTLSSSALLLAQTRPLSNMSQQLQLAPSLTTISMESARPHTTIATARPIHLHIEKKKKQHKQKYSAGLHHSGAAVIHPEKEEEEQQKYGATDSAQYDISNNNNNNSDSVKRITSARPYNKSSIIKESKTIARTSNVLPPQEKELLPISLVKEDALSNKIEHADVHKAGKSLHATLQSKEFVDTTATSAFSATPRDDNRNENKKDKYDNSSSKTQKLCFREVEKENERKLINVADEVQFSQSTEVKEEKTSAPVELLSKKEEELQSEEVEDLEQKQPLQLQMPTDSKNTIKEAVCASEELKNDFKVSEDSRDITAANARSIFHNETEVREITKEHHNNANKELTEDTLHNFSTQFSETSKKEPSLSQRSLSLSSSAASISLHTSPSPLSSKHNNLSEVKLIVNAIMPSEKTGPIHSLSTSNIGYKSSLTTISPKLITSQHAHQSIMHETANHSGDDKGLICEEHVTINKFNNENILTHYASEKHDNECDTQQSNDDASFAVNELWTEEYAIADDQNDKNVHYEIVVNDYNDVQNKKEQEHTYETNVQEDVTVMESSSEDKSSIAPHVNVETSMEKSLTDEANVVEESKVLQELEEESANENEEKEKSVANNLPVESSESIVLLPDKLALEAKDKETCLAQVVNDARQPNSESISANYESSKEITLNEEEEEFVVITEPIQKIPDEQLMSRSKENFIANEETAVCNDNIINKEDVNSIDDVLEKENVEAETKKQESKNEKSNIDVNLLNAAENLYSNDHDEHNNIVDDVDGNNDEDENIMQHKETVCTDNEFVEDNNLNNQFNMYEEAEHSNDEINNVDQEDEESVQNNNNYCYNNNNNVVHSGIINDNVDNDVLHKTMNIDTEEQTQPIFSQSHEQEELVDEELEKEKGYEESIDQLPQDKASLEPETQKQKNEFHETNETTKTKSCEEMVRRLVSLLLPAGSVASMSEEESSTESTAFATNTKAKEFHDECMEEIKEFILDKFRTTHASDVSNNNDDDIGVIGAHYVDNTRSDEKLGNSTLNEKQSFSFNEVIPDYFESRSAYIRKLRKELLLDNPNKLSPCASPKARAPLSFNEIKELSQQASASTSSKTKEATTTTTITANSSALTTSYLASADVGSQNVLLAVNNDKLNEAPMITTIDDEVNDPLDDGSYQQQNVQYVLDLFGNAMQSSNTFCAHTLVGSKEITPINIALRQLFDPPTRPASTRAIEKSHEHESNTVAAHVHSTEE